jgi:ATP-dependent Clp protease, protease subunit
MKIRMAGKKKAEVWIYEDIGEGWFGGLSAKRFADELKQIGQVDVINVRINSAGGDVFDAFAIYNTLVRNPASIEIDIDGMALSAASLIAMAGDKIRMADNAMFMIHDPWSMSAGNADQMRSMADTLDQTKENLVSTYTKRSKLDDQTVSTMMSEETWLRASQAKELGFVDEVTTGMEIAAHCDVNRFKNIPREFVSRIESRKPQALDMMRATIRDMSQKVAEIQTKSQQKLAAEIAAVIERNK